MYHFFKNLFKIPKEEEMFIFIYLKKGNILQSYAFRNVDNKYAYIGDPGFVDGCKMFHTDVYGPPA